MTKPLTPAQAKAFYDRFGSKQDSQGFYEDRALKDLIEYSDFGAAQHVFEYGCGTGRFAEQLLKCHLPASAFYDGVDISSTMVELAQNRVAPFSARARVRQTNGVDAFSELELPIDCVVSTYVLDLLAADQITAFLDRVAEILDRGGKLCLVSLTSGRGPLSLTVSAAWNMLYKLSPGLVGGCRPIRLLEYIQAPRWEVSHHAVVTSFGVPSEVVVAERRAG